MSIASLMPTITTNISIGGGAPFGSSDMFEPSSYPAFTGGSFAGGSFAGPTGGSSGLVSSLLQSALGASSSGEKSDLIKAALDLMGGGSSQSIGSSPAAYSDPSSATGATYASPDTSGNNLSVNGNTVDTGRYTVTGSTSDDGSLTITDKQTGQSDKIWGDPHVDVNGKDVAGFQKDGLTINLPDGTRIEMKPTSLNSDGKAHLDQAVISNGGQAVTMSGFTGGGGVQTSGVQTDSESLEQSAMTPGETVLDAVNGLSDLHYTNADGSVGAALSDTGSEQDLDGSGGADPTGSLGSGSSGMVTQLLQQAQQATDPQTKSDLIKAALDLTNGGGNAATFGASDFSGAGGSNGMATQLLQQAEQSTDPQTQNDLIKAAMDLTNGNQGSNLSTELLQQAEQSTDPQEQNDLIKAAMDLNGGGSSFANSSMLLQNVA